ncbi:MAG TPA: ABC transporter ATP-binding protein [Chloroflexota bacterium]|nr:ABC transporter ATP-binding protein [Chloroflexota bacterium]
MIEVRGVSRRYRMGEAEVWALRDATLRIPDGDYLTIVGPSGSGKSTFLQIVGLLDRPTVGSVEMDGRDVGQLGDEERARLRLTTIGFVFQRFHLLADMTAIENVALPMEAAGIGAVERYARAGALLQRVGLGERQLFMPAQLSGGQRQRVAVARALANDPRLILADEPTGELHSEDKATIVGLFRQLNDEGRTIVMVTHDPEVAAAARRRVEIRDGQVGEVER